MIHPLQTFKNNCSLSHMKDLLLAGIKRKYFCCYATSILQELVSCEPYLDTLQSYVHRFIIFQFPYQGQKGHSADNTPS